MLILTLTSFVIRKLGWTQQPLRLVFLGSLLLFSVAAEAQHENSNIETSHCEEDSVSLDFQIRFDKLKKQLEAGYSQGLPLQLKESLTKIREKSDSLSSQLVDQSRNPLNASAQEDQQLIASTIDHVGAFIKVVPNIAKLAPKVRAELVLPLSNLYNETEKMNCSPALEKQKPVYAEIDRLNSMLYTAQSLNTCLLYTSPSPRDRQKSRMPSSA